MSKHSDKKTKVVEYRYDHPQSYYQTYVPTPYVASTYEQPLVVVQQMNQFNINNIDKMINCTKYSSNINHNSRTNNNKRKKSSTRSFDIRIELLYVLYAFMLRQ